MCVLSGHSVHLRAIFAIVFVSNLAFLQARKKKFAVVEKKSCLDITAVSGMKLFVNVRVVPSDLVAIRVEFG